MTTNAQVSLETYVDHIDRVCQLAGNARHAAIGTNLDTIAGLQRLPDLLRRHGYAASDVAAILQRQLGAPAPPRLGRRDGMIPPLTYGQAMRGSMTLVMKRQASIIPRVQSIDDFSLACYCRSWQRCHALT